MLKFIQEDKQKEEIADYILKQLPDWFGVPASVKQYVANVKSMPFWAEITEK